MDCFQNLHLTFNPQMWDIWIHIMLHFLSNRNNRNSVRLKKPENPLNTLILTVSQ